MPIRSVGRRPRHGETESEGFEPGRGAWGCCSMALALGAGDALAGQLPVSLGKAGSFAALAGSTVTSTGLTTLNGDLGVSPGSSLTGFPPGKVNGTIHATDPTAAQAQADLTAAYNDAAGRQPPQALPADVGGQTLAPGVYKTGATPALGLTGTLTLDGQGNRNAVFVIQVGSALTTAVASHVNLIGRAQAGNVFWQIGSSATLGTSSTFAGSILALTSISIDSGVTLNGRALARNGAVTLIDDTITVPTQAPTPTPTPTPSPTPGPSPPPPVGGGRTGFCVAGDAPTSPADKHPPARPLLRFPRGGARVSVGIVKFRWRPAARAARYTLMVDKRRMSTGCATRAAIPIGTGSHSYRVIAQNRYGARSSRSRAFFATTAPGQVEKIPVRGNPTQITFTPSIRAAVGRAGKGRARAAVMLIAGCDYSVTVNFNEGGPTPTRVDFSVDAECNNGILTRPGRSVVGVQASIVNSRNVQVSGIARCFSVLGTCSAHGIYHPKLGSYTRQLGLRATLGFFKKGAIQFPANKRTFKECHLGIGSPLLICRFTDRFITLDHRCDLTPVRRSSLPPQAAVPATELYPSNQTPLAPFLDGRGRVSRLFWGRSKQTKPLSPNFFDGKGYRHIAQKHGFGPADEQATRNAIHGRPITTTQDKKKSGRFIKRIYEGSRYTQNATNCARVVVISYPPRSSTGGTIITSYGAVVGEPGSDLPSQG